MFLIFNLFCKRLAKAIKLILLCSAVMLCSCSQPAVENSTDDNTFQEYEGLTIANPDVVPVFDGTKTSTFLVLNNYTDKPITDIHFYLNNSINSDNKTILSGGFDGCSTILPHSSCRVNYDSPLLSATQLDSASDLFVVNYKFANEARTVTTPISYKLVYNDDASTSSMIMSMGSPSYMNGTNGTRSAMVYLYVKGKDPVSLNHEGFDIGSFTVTNKNFEDTSIPTGTVLTYEVSATYNKTNNIKSYLSNMSIARFTLDYTDNNDVKQTTAISVASTPSYLTGPYIVMQPIPSLHSNNGSNSESFMVYNVGPQSTTVTLTTNGAINNNISLSTNSFSLPANGGSQLVMLTVNNIGSSSTGTSITATASSGNTVTQPFVIIGGSNLIVFSPPYYYDLQNYAPSITQIVSLTNSLNSMGNIKLLSVPNVMVSGTNASYITATTGSSVSNYCAIGTILTPGSSCNYSISLALNAPANSTFSTPYYLATTVSYASSQDNYTATQTSQSLITGKTYFTGGNVIESGMPNSVTIEGNNAANLIYKLTFINDTSSFSSGITPGVASVSNIQLESTAPSFVYLSTSGLTNPCNIGQGKSTSLLAMESCNVNLNIGPVSSKSLVNGVSALTYNYINNIYQGQSSGVSSFSYSVIPESLSLVIQSVSPSNTIGGTGSSASPWVFSGGANGATQNITVWYKNTGNESIVIESFPFGYGISGYSGTNTFWLPQDNCSNVNLAPNASCSIVYQQNYYITANSQGCNGTSQTMNIVSPSVIIKGVASGNQYTLSDLTYPSNDSNTLYANESNIYISNNFTATNTGTMTPNVYNTYTSNISSTIANAVIGYGSFTLNFNTVLVTSNWGGYVAAPTATITGVTGSCQYTSTATFPAFDNPWTQSCSYNAGSSGSIGESGYKFMSMPGSLYLFPNFTVTNTSTANQVFCINTPNNQINLQ